MCRQQSSQSHCLNYKTIWFPQPGNQPASSNLSVCIVQLNHSFKALNKRVMPFRLWTMVSHCATSRHRDTFLNQSSTVWNKGLSTEVLKARGEVADSEDFLLHLQRLGHKKIQCSLYFSFRGKDEFVSYPNYFWVAWAICDGNQKERLCSSHHSVTGNHSPFLSTQSLWKLLFEHFAQMPCNLGKQKIRSTKDKMTKNPELCNSKPPSAFTLLKEIHYCKWL